LISSVAPVVKPSYSPARKTAARHIISIASAAEDMPATVALSFDMLTGL
jgi:hypothetical protein